MYFLENIDFHNAVENFNKDINDIISKQNAFDFQEEI